MNIEKTTIADLKTTLKRVKTFYSDALDNAKSIKVSTEAVEFLESIEGHEFEDRAGLLALIAVSEANKGYIPNINVPNVMNEHIKVTNDLLSAHGEKHSIDVTEAIESTKTLGLTYEEMLVTAKSIISDAIAEYEHTEIPEVEPIVSPDGTHTTAEGKLIEGFDVGGEEHTETKVLVDGKLIEGSDLDEVKVTGSVVVEKETEKVVSVDGDLTDIIEAKPELKEKIEEFQKESEKPEVIVEKTGGEEEDAQEIWTSEPLKEADELESHKDVEDAQEIYEGDEKQREGSDDLGTKGVDGVEEIIEDDVLAGLNEDGSAFEEFSFEKVQFAKGGKAKITAIFKENGLTDEVELMNEKKTFTLPVEVIEEIKPFIK